MRSYRYLHYDVFTDHLFGGNQLAVVLDGRGLSAAVMQAIAKEMNFSETTFVLPPERTDTDVRMRIFTPGDELPMAGHPTVGSTFALARAGVIEPGRARFVFGLGIGPVPVALEWRGEVQVVSCGLPFLFVPLTTRRAVDQARVDAAALEAVLRQTSTRANGVFLFSAEPGNDGATVYSRMFAPGLGVVEDPATGSASGPLGCYLVRYNVVAPQQAAAMLSLQGVKMGRPSHVHISIGLTGGAISSVRVGGRSVLAGEGTLYV